MEKAVLAYSGGLDTSVTIRWLSDQGYEVHAVAVDVGQREDFGEIVERGEQAGAASVRVVDAVDRYAAEFLAPAIKANGLYEGKYPMVSGLARPCIVEEVVTVAREIDASTVAHGCTGKGNDQVRFEVGFGVLAPDLQVLAPIRDADIPREKAIASGRRVGHPDREPGEDLFGRREPVGPHRRMRSAGGPVGGAARGRVRTHGRAAGPAHRAHGGRRGLRPRGCRWRSTARRPRCPRSSARSTRWAAGTTGSGGST